MNITEHEMRGLLAGKCIPADILVNEALPSYLVRKFFEAEDKLRIKQNHITLRDTYIAELEGSVEGLQQKLDVVLAGLDGLAGAMLNRTLDSGSKQASAYADCANMLARYNAQLRAETDTTPSQYESLAGGK